MESQAQQIATKITEGGLVCLYGDLGSGKTTFTKKVADFLGIPNFKIKSPTYTYIRRYNLKPDQHFYHLDLYRLAELDHIMLEEIEGILENPQNIVMIEWPERMEKHLPSQRINIYLEHIGNGERSIKIEY